MGLIPTVSKFLCCLSLEMGGYICGIFTAVVSGITLASSISLLFTNLSSNDAGWWTILILNIIYFSLLLFASIMLVLGTKNSQPNKMRLFLLFMLVGVIVAFLQIILNPLAGIIIGILWTCIVVYFFICIYSLFVQAGGSGLIC
ncbi:uncharacterized protein [Chironomus tepperi]|uniref:uncharacterized protein n=1 Tax=Chironomus tepperi TaxID=113505 RepID=UPI00391FAFD2